MKDMIRECKNLKYRLVSMLPYLLLGLVVMISLAPVYEIIVPGKPANADNRASLDRSGWDVKETTKQAILHWMKENSGMPEQVLLKIYSVAVNSVNTDLILSICLVESNFNPRVESEKGAIGLMGIMPDVWLEELKAHGIVREKEDLYTISSNINSGLYVLERYLANATNLREALSRYAGGDPAYAARVLRMLGQISRARCSEEHPYLEGGQNPRVIEASKGSRLVM